MAQYKDHPQIVQLSGVQHRARDVSHALAAQEGFEPLHPRIGQAKHDQACRDSEKHEGVVHGADDDARRAEGLDIAVHAEARRADVSAVDTEGGGDCRECCEPEEKEESDDWRVLAEDCADAEEEEERVKWEGACAAPADGFG